MTWMAALWLAETKVFLGHPFEATSTGKRGACCVEEVTVQCPSCLSVVNLEIDPDESGSFVQDCEICCRPWLVRVARDEDGNLVVSVEKS